MGAEAPEVAFVWSSHRPRTDRIPSSPLFDALKIEGAHHANRPLPTIERSPPIADRTAEDKPGHARAASRSGLAFQKHAFFTVMTAVLPDFEAFYASLADEQKDSLQPRRMMRDGGFDDRGRACRP